jgi:ABC-2 type transport system permease protein
MNIQSDAMHESRLESHPVTMAAISPARRMYWSIRRELWENRSVYLAPLGAAAVFLFGFLVSMITLPQRTRAALALPPLQQHEALEEPYMIAAGLIMAVAFIVGLYYSLEALHGERRDRSILFWKSLPVSDLTTVLSKAVIPTFVLPLFSFAVTVATQLIMLLLNSAVLLGSGLSVAKLWTHVPLFQMSLMLLYHLLTVHVFWYAPIYGWLLLASAWARRAAFLWAGLPLFAIFIVEKIAFNTSHFVSWLEYRIAGPQAFPSTPPGSIPMEAMVTLDLGKFLSTPGLWVGLAAAAAFFAAAARLRRYRGPI